MSKHFYFLLVLLLPVAVFGSPEAVDEHGCHRAANDVRFHCHNSKPANSGHAYFGLISNTDGWFYSNGPMNLFTGAGLAAEYAYSSIAARASLSTQVHLTGEAGYKLYGWDVAVKAGHKLSLPGFSPYAELGYYRQHFYRVNGALNPYGGFQIGAGLMWSNQRFALDAKVLSRAKNGLEAVWIELGAPGVSANIHAQVGAYLRF